MSDARRPQTLRDLLPDLSEQEFAVARERFREYLAVALEIYQDTLRPSEPVDNGFDESSAKR